jgi:hypothetical protein
VRFAERRELSQHQDLCIFSASINNEEGQRNALAKFEPGVTLWWAYAVTTSSRDARERSIELAGSI